MKHYLFIALTLLSFGVKAQTLITKNLNEKTIVDPGNVYYSVYTYQVYDTVSIWLDVNFTDTTGNFSNFATIPGGHKIFFRFAMKGYEIRKNNPSFDTWDCGGNACIGWRDHKTHFKYLDSDKHEISKSIIVWQTK